MRIDIKGAFVQTPMKGEPIYMKIDPKILKYVIGLYPDLKVKMGKTDAYIHCFGRKCMDA
jgi:hypothetical protein